jgi:hypothetical protein
VVGAGRDRVHGQAVASADVRLNAGDWKPVAKQSWGGWAAYHVVQGTTVQVRTTSTGGSSVLSPCYQWIPTANQDAATVACPNGPPPPPPPPPPTHGLRARVHRLEER